MTNRRVFKFSSNLGTLLYESRLGQKEEPFAAPVSPSGSHHADSSVVVCISGNDADPGYRALLISTFWADGESISNSRPSAYRRAVSPSEFRHFLIATPGDSPTLHSLSRSCMNNGLPSQAVQDSVGNSCRKLLDVQAVHLDATLHKQSSIMAPGFKSFDLCIRHTPWSHTRGQQEFAWYGLGGAVQKERHRVSVNCLSSSESASSRMMSAGSSER